MITDPDVLAIMAQFREDMVEASARAAESLLALGLEPEDFLAKPSRYFALLGEGAPIPRSREESIALGALHRLIALGAWPPAATSFGAT